MSVQETEPNVGVIMGSDSDLPSTMIHVGQALRDTGLAWPTDYETRIVSAHRTSEWMRDYASSAEERGLQVVIAGAGGSAHLQGMSASETTLPLIGVAVTSHSEVMNRALGSTIGMPEGKPLGVFQNKVGAYNAGLFASRILSVAGLDRVGIVCRSGEDPDSHASRALRRLGLSEEDDFETITLSPAQAANLREDWARNEGFGSLIVTATGRDQLPTNLATAVDVPVLGVAVTDNPDVMRPSLSQIVDTEKYVPIAAFQGPAGAFNAGLFAVRIMGLSSPTAKEATRQYDQDLTYNVRAKDRLLKEIGDEAYSALYGTDELAKRIAEYETELRGD